LNYSGKFDARLPADGAGLHAHGPGHVQTFAHHATHAPSDAIIVPDARLLFHGDFKRAGVDLILSNDDRELVLHDYFKGEKRAALASPDGAHLTGDIVDALTGHTQFAQAGGGASGGQVIGHVTKLAGTATAVRNGVSIILNNGDNVEKGDVIQSGSNSTLGITFIDGTVFGLSSNARMVLNEMVYDPNGSNNSSLLSLVAGAITFVAGETAKHGDMKIDTPVATMGIRGTAVLCEIDFHVALPQDPLVDPHPLPNLPPSAIFQVLVEPDGHTGSYILFDKTTLTPIATVNQAGQQINISQGQVSITNSPLSPDLQKLITDVFSLKFTDNSNTKTFEHFTDSVIPQQFGGFKLPDGSTALPIFFNVKTADSAPAPPSNGPINSNPRVPGPPTAVVLDAGGHVNSVFAITEIANTTGDSLDVDGVTIRVNWVDVNRGDVPTASATFDSFTYKDAHGNNVTAALNANQLADIVAVEAKLLPTPDPGNNNNGSATFTFGFADKNFDFLAAGETLTLTYRVKVEDNFAANNEATFLTFTITITGTNDVPVITTSAPALAFTGDHEVVAGFLSAKDPVTGNPVPTSGTLAFKDPDLTDTHSVKVALATPAWSGGTVPPGPLAAFEAALTASIGTDSTGTGNGTINWQLAALPDYLADFLPKGETLTLTYTITVTDSLGATAIQHVTITITHTTPPDVAWIHSTGGSWDTASNWETGTVPTASDDVVIPDEQVIGGTGHYAVTITSAAAAKSVTLNADNTSGAQLINDSTLTIGGALTLLADGLLNNSGEVSVGGKIELQNQSSLQNSGLITLGQGGDFKDQSTVTNFKTGTIEVSGGTLNVLVDVANSGLITVDPNANLTLDHAAIDGGTVTNNGEIDLTGAAVLKNGSLGNFGQIKVSGAGNALDNEKVTSNHALEVMAGAALLLDQDTTVANGGGVITVDGTATLTLNDATINGGTVNDYSLVSGNIVAGSIDVTGDSKISGAALNNGGVTIASGKTLTLDKVAVSGTTFTDTASGAVLSVDATDTLKLSNVIINGGTVNDGTGTTALTGGKIEIVKSSAINGASSTELASLNNGGVTVDANQTLTLDNVAVSGTTITGTDATSVVQVEGGKTLALTGNATIEGSSSAAKATISNSGTIEVAGTATLLNDTLTNVTTGSIIQVDDGQTLMLSGTEIIGGTINDYSGALGGNIDVTGNSKIDGGAKLNFGTVTVEAGKTLTLDNVTVNGTSFTDSGAIIQVDDGTTLTLHGATINGGTINDGTATGTVSGAGTVFGDIDVTGNSTISNASLNYGDIKIEQGISLTLDNVAVTGTSIEVDGVSTVGKLILENGTTISGSQLTIDSSDQLTMNGATITGGAITDNGSIDVTKSSTINGDAKLSNGNATVENGVTLKLDNVTVTGTTFTDISASGSIIQVDSGDTLTLDGATFNGGKFDNNGIIDVIGSTTTISANVSGSGTAIIDGNATLRLDGAFTETVTFADNAGTLKLGPSSSFTGHVAGFASGTTLDVLGFLATKVIYDSSNGTLTVSDATHTASIKLTGDFSNSTFLFSSDGHGGTNIVDSPTVSMVQDHSHTFSIADFAFHDSDETDSLANVIITKLPGHGTLTLNGVAVDLTNGPVSVSAADIANGKLVFMPNTDAHSDSFQFKVQDSIGNDISPTATLTINLGSDGQPTAVASSVNATQDTTYTFQASDFKVSDTGDATADSLAKVIITSLPANGTLKLNGVAVDLSNGPVSVSAADITNGKLVFTPNTDAHSDTFTFKVQDSIGNDISPTAATLTINLGSDSQPTAVASSVNGTQDTTYTFQASDFKFSDTGDTAPDSLANVIITTLPSNGTLYYNNGTTLVAVTAGQVISAADIASGKLTFAPNTDAHSDAFTFKVQDSIGHDISPTAATLTITLAASITGPTEPFVWVSQTGGSWSDPANWNNAGFVPGALDQVQINSNVTVTIESVEVSNLLLDNDATLTNGALTIASGGTLQIEAGPNGSGATLDGVSVSNSGTVQVDSAATPPATLVLDDGTTISGGNLTIGNGSTLDAEAPKGTLGPTNPDAMLDTVNVTNNGTIEIGVNTSGAILALDGDSSIVGGNLAIGSNSALDIESGLTNLVGAVLEGVHVSTADSSSSQITLGNTGAAKMTLDGGTTVTGGTVSVGGGSTLAIGAPAGPHATVYTVAGFDAALDYTLAPNSEITVDANGHVTSAIIQFVGQTDTYSLSVPGSTVFQNLGNSPPLTQFVLFGTGNAGDIVISTTTLDLTDPQWTSHLFVSQDYLFNQNLPQQYSYLNLTIAPVLGATLDGVSVNGTNAVTDSVTPTPASTIAVGASGPATLTLDDGTIITNGALTIATGSTLAILQGSNDLGATLDGVSVSSSGAIHIGSVITGDPTLTLDDGTTISGGTLVIGHGDTLDIEPGANGPGATLSDVQVSSIDLTSTITVGNGSTLTLDAAFITGGTIDDFTSTTGGIIPGDIDIAVSSTINGGAILNNGNVTIEAGQTLTLDNMTANGTTFDDTATGS
jgi:hypothetical protein